MEELGVWRETFGYRGKRGCVYRVYRTADGKIRICEVEWSAYSGEHAELIHEFGSLDEAADAGYEDLLYNMYITQCGRDVEVWRERRANT